jgi:hypothetical protein
MGTEKAKGTSEVAVFAAFVSAASLPYDLRAVEKRLPPEPGLLCAHQPDGPVAFELLEICDANLAEFNATVKEGGAYYMRTADPSAQLIAKKLRRNYETTHPIELLCYSAGRVVTPADVIIPAIRPYLRSLHHVFRRAWLLSRGQVYEVWNGG